MVDLATTRKHEIARLQSVQRYLLMAIQQLSELQLYRWLNVSAQIHGRSNIRIHRAQEQEAPTYEAPQSPASSQVSVELDNRISELIHFLEVDKTVDRVNLCLTRITAEIQLLENIYIPPYLAWPSEVAIGQTSCESYNLQQAPLALVANPQVNDPSYPRGS